MLFATNWLKVRTYKVSSWCVYGVTEDGMVFIVFPTRIEVRNAFNVTVPFNITVHGPRDVRDVQMYADGSIRIDSASRGSHIFHDVRRVARMLR